MHRKQAIMNGAILVAINISIVIAILFAAINCDALAAEPIDNILRPSQLFGIQEPWETQSLPRTDADDQKQWRGCVRGNDNSEIAAAEIHRSNNLAASGHFDEAVQQLSDAIQRLPSNYPLRLNRAKLYIKMEQNDPARNDLRVAATNLSSDLFVEFEVEKLLVKLGEYELAAQTISAILPKISNGMGPMCRAHFQYLLACCDQQLGDPAGAVDNYSAAANCFITQRAFSAAAVCVKQMKDIASRHALRVPDIKNFDQITALRTGVPELKAMIKHLVSDSNCLELATVQKLTRDQLHEIRPGVYGDACTATSTVKAPVSPLTGIEGIEFGTFHTGKGQILGISMTPFDCRLSFTALNDILAFQHPLPQSDSLKTHGYKNYLYKVPCGTLLFMVDSSGTVIRINLYNKEALNQARASQRQTVIDRRHGIGYIIQSGNFNDALAITDAWLKEIPGDIKAHGFRAQALALAGRYEEAIEAIDFGINHESAAKDNRSFTNPSAGNTALIQKGTYQTGLGEYAKALHTFDQAFPKTLNADNYFYRAQAEIGLGRVEDGCADLEKAVSLYFNDARIVRRDEAAKLLRTTQAKLHSTGNIKNKSADACCPN